MTVVCVYRVGPFPWGHNFANVRSDALGLFACCLETFVHTNTSNLSLMFFLYHHFCWINVRFHSKVGSDSRLIDHTVQPGYGYKYDRVQVLKLTEKKLTASRTTASCAHNHTADAAPS